ncbi:MAG TPA: glycosyltransferase [Terriglobales bacterium]|nr:glycosyltransferase [Terriglobales bacterium]
MRIVIFCHSIRSDWNHGNAHFLRGIATELQQRGHDVAIYEPRDAWSVQQLVARHGASALRGYRSAYPTLTSVRYDERKLDLDRALAGADLVLVHEWNSRELVAAIGAHRARSGTYRLFFHDTHHRAVTDPAAMVAFDLSAYDGVLAFGRAIADIYQKRHWAKRVFIWHEAADVRVFRPKPRARSPQWDLLWIGNWGDEERSDELREFLIEPVRALGLRAAIYGVRYPAAARRELSRAGIEYRDWLPNYRAPQAFARARVTIHVPRRPYARTLPGIPTIRVFEALACGIPLVSAPWKDSEKLFTPGEDYLVARTRAEMIRALAKVRDDDELAERLRRRGHQTILARHTCAHRTDELLAIYDSFEGQAECAA